MKTGEYSSMVATLTDDLSIKEYWAEMRFTSSPGGLTIDDHLFLPREGAVAVDAYNAPTLTQATLASSFTAHTYRAVQNLDDVPTLASLNLLAVGRGLRP